ncbi:hypothetical protein ACFQXA_37070 [Nocardiopsis composta]
MTPAPGGTGPARARRPGAGHGEAPFEEALRAIAAARDPAELFGPPPEDAGPPGAAAVAAYRRLARRVHPDRAPGARGRGRARLRRARRALGGAPRRGRDRGRHRPGHPDPQVPGGPGGGPGRHRRRPPGPLPGRRAARRRAEAGPLPADNDLLLAEAEALERITGHGRPEFRAFFPEPVEAIRHRDPATGVERHGTVLGGLAGFVPSPSCTAPTRTGSTRATRRGCGAGCSPPPGPPPRRGRARRDRARARADPPRGARPGPHRLVLLGDRGRPGPARPGAGPGPHRVLPARGARPPPRRGGDRRVHGGPLHGAHHRRAAAEAAAGLRPRLHPALPARRPADGFAALSDLDDLLERRYGPRRFRPFSTPARRIAL